MLKIEKTQLFEQKQEVNTLHFTKKNKDEDKIQTIFKEKKIKSLDDDIENFMIKQNDEMFELKKNQFQEKKLFDLSKCTEKRILNNSKQNLTEIEIEDFLENNHDKEIDPTISSMSECLEKSDIRSDVLEIIYKEKPSAEIEVFKDIITLMPSQLEECLKGAHVHIDDGGEFYMKWKQNKGAYSRDSSHPHIQDTKMYGIPGPWGHEFLFGLVKDTKTKKIKTWFQFENTTAKDFVGTVLHIADYFSYKITGKNVGPYGYSVHVDNNPIQITYNKE